MNDPQERSLAIVPDAVLTPGLSGLADTANKEHGLAQQSASGMVQHAIACGVALTEAKSLLAHGEWLPWLKSNFDGSVRTSQAYMQVANTQRVAYLEESSLRKVLAAITETKDVHVSQNTGENEWYTPAPFIDAAIEVMGGIDLDPASSSEANKLVGADTYYTKENSGLEQPWEGRVWLNPPYTSDLVTRFADKLTREYKADRVDQACLLTNNATETQWFQKTVRVANAVCFPDGRITYWNPDRTSRTPLQGQAVLYFGPSVSQFCKTFGELGVVFGAVVGAEDNLTFSLVSEPF